MQFELRPATDRDHEYLYALHRAAMRESVARTWGWDEAWQRAHFDARFEPRGVEVIWAGGRPVGALRIEERAAELYVASLAVAPEAQGRGLGTAVMRDLLARAGVRRVPVALQVLKTNPGARRLYERLGFRAAGETATHVRLRHDAGAPACTGDREAEADTRSNRHG